MGPLPIFIAWKRHLEYRAFGRIYGATDHDVLLLVRTLAPATV
jgi:hypothetical protein